MKREVVQDFLNLPGIMGVALMHGRFRPYFCGVDQTLNFQQKEALAQGIQQVIETTPAGFEFFEFQFNGHQIYIYKLEQGVILLVLTVDNMGYATHATIIDRLKVELQKDVNDAINTFRVVAGSTPLSEKNYWKSSNSEPVLPAVLSADPEPADCLSTSLRSLSISLRDLLMALNHLSRFAAQYLGATVVTNHWQAARPDVEWLKQFEIDRAAQINFIGQTNGKMMVSREQHQWIQLWVEAFIDRCSKVMRNFPKMVRQKALDAHQKLLLLSDLS
ncbi:MAG TPA: hypothetical protein V6C57_15425 [Coleofasciculaceae cyanobacterium]